MGEMELHVMAQRLWATAPLAGRGELRVPLPVGLVYDDDGTVVLDPDAEVQAAIGDVFAAFAATGSAYGVAGAFAGRRFPLRLRRRVGGAAALGGAHPRPGDGDRRTRATPHSVRVRPLHVPPHRRPRRHGAHLDHRTAPRRMARADQRSPRELHHLGGLPGERSQAGGQPHRRRGPAAPRGHRAVLWGSSAAVPVASKPMMTNYHTGQRPSYTCSSRCDRLTTLSCRTVVAACVDDAVAGALALLEALTPEQVALALAAADQVTGQHQGSAARPSSPSSVLKLRGRTTPSARLSPGRAGEPASRPLPGGAVGGQARRPGQAEQALEAAQDTLPPPPSRDDLGETR